MSQEFKDWLCVIGLAFLLGGLLLGAPMLMQWIAEHAPI